MERNFKRSRSGTTLIVAIIAIATLSGFVAVSLLISNQISRAAQRSRAWTDGTNIGLGMIDFSFSIWRAKCRENYSTDLPGTSFAFLPFLATPLNMFPITNYKLSNFIIQAVDPQLNVVATAPPPANGQSASAKSTFYLASADVAIPVVPGVVTTKVRRVFEKQSLSPWNYAIFYNDPLEIHPGPPFTVTGWVHTNSILYTGSSSLTFASKATYSTGWQIGFMPGDGSHPGPPASPFWPQDIPPAPEPSHQPFGFDPTTIFDPKSSNPNISQGWRELITRPNTSFPDPLNPPAPATPIRYYNQAGVKVLIDAAGQKTIIDQNGTVLTGGRFHDTIDSAVSVGAPIQDNREAGLVRLTTLDVSGIYGNGTYNTNANGMKGFNGIIYISDTSSVPGTKRGIRLLNGSRIANEGLTVVSDNPVYIQGDYNTGGPPPSNAAFPDPTRPTALGYTRQAAAIIADAVYVLSNAWNDALSAAPLASRVASNTTVNAALLAGIVPTGTVGSNYSGGVENFPRFLEDWTGKSLTYYGSMVELFPSRQAVGAWGAANVYNPPNRSWYFDPFLQTNPPPGGLVLTNYVKGRWYLQ